MPMSDLLNVGPNKPVGYLPLDTITELYGYNFKQLLQELETKGLKLYYVTAPEVPIYSGALFAYDEVALRVLLDSHKELLAAKGWINDPEVFVHRIAREVVDMISEHELYRLVGLAFSDPRFTQVTTGAKSG